MLIGYDRKVQTLAQNESVTVQVVSLGAIAVRYFANFASGGTVDASLQPRGKMAQQFEDGQWYDPSPSSVSAEGDELQTLNEWPFSTTQIVITNNSADPLDVEVGLVASR